MIPRSFKVRTGIGLTLLVTAGLLSTSAIAAPAHPQPAPTPPAPIAQPAPVPVAAPSAQPTCAFASLTQPFGAAGDSNSYFLAPSGDFEGDTGSGTMSGGAGIVAGNQTLFADPGSSSLALSTTSASFTTSTFCVTTAAPTFRMLIKNNGNLGHIDGQLAVYLNFSGADGKPQQVKIAALKVDSTTWTLSPPISFIQYLSTPLKSGYANISLTLTPNDNHGNWQIDNIYIDPFCSH